MAAAAAVHLNKTKHDFILFFKVRKYSALIVANFFPHFLTQHVARSPLVHLFRQVPVMQ